MNGPEHYLEAERLLTGLVNAHGYPVSNADTRVARAQVHATLALAAASALGSLPSSCFTDEADPAAAWAEAVR